MHNFFPSSPVLGNHLQLLSAQPRLCNVCLKIMSPGVLWPPPLSLALGVPQEWFILEFSCSRIILPMTDYTITHCTEVLFTQAYTHG